MTAQGFSRLAIGLAFTLAFSRVPTATAQEICGDVDGSGSLVAADALLVLSAAVGLPENLVCPSDSCGDGVLSGEEECDQGDLNGATCESQGLFGEGLACGADCVLDSSGCGQARFVDNGDGTVTDNQTGLQWEKKTDDDSIHDKDNTYTWSTAGSVPDGTAFLEFLNGLNACIEAPGFPPEDVTGGFADQCDWRLPTVVELQTIVDTTVTDCGGGGAACIDPIFGPTINYNYWTSTAFAENTNFAWFADFDVGQVEEGSKTGAFHVRAVRGAR